MGQDYRLGVIIYLFEHQLNIHAKRARSDIYKYRFQAGVQYRGDVAYPGKCGHNDFTFTFKLA